MPNYKRPGVFVEESLNPLITPLSVPGEAPAAFVGFNSRGSVSPVNVTSWQQYIARFGSFGDGSSYLPYAVYQYFNNGGRNAYVVRAARADAVSATLTLNNRAGTPAPLIRLTAENPGSWGNTVFIEVTDTSISGTGRFDLVVRLGSTADSAVVERWLDVTANPQDARYFVTLVNAASEDGGSAYIKAMGLRAPTTYQNNLASLVSIGGTSLTLGSTAGLQPGQALNIEPGVANAESVVITSITNGTQVVVPALTKGHASGSLVTTGSVYGVTDTPSVLVSTALASGADGVGAYDLVTTTKTLEIVQDNINVNLPGVYDSAIINPLIAWAESKDPQNIFLIVDAPPAAQGATSSATATAMRNLVSGGGSLTPSSYVSVYGPWLFAKDPGSSVASGTRVLPPGGAVLGIYAVTDASRGVQKPPAGVEARISGILNVETKFANADLDSLNQSGINIIKPVPNYGFCIWGARTLLTGFPSRYVSIRRTLMEIKNSISTGTLFAVMEPNEPGLWSLITSTLEQYLTSLMQVGILKGNTPDESFYVKCDAENNPPQSVAAGEVHIEVGVALQTPAEFVVIRIGQYEGSTQAVEVNV